MNTISENLQDKIKLLIAEFGEERIKTGELLKYHTFSSLGGTAEIFFVATSQSELTRILNLAYELKIPYQIFGSGTKLLVSEKGFSGLVIKNRTGAVKISGIKGKVGASGIGIEEALVEADSGVSLGKLNEFLAEQKLQEISGFSSLKSTIGGAIFLDQELRMKTQQLKVWDRGDILNIPLEELNRKIHVVLSVVVKVKSQE